MRISALVFSLLLVALARPAAAQTCPLNAPPFAGHNFPADGSPVEPGPIQLVAAFPNLTFTRPVFLTWAPDGSDRIFVVEQAGRIRVFANSDAVTSTSLFLDLTSQVQSIGNEQGLLGLAFDPDYATNGFFYVNYTAPASLCIGANVECTKIVRYRVSTGNPNAADPQSALQLLQFAQPDNDHNGGMLAFGPDGMLYIASGDGGDYQSFHAQDLTARLGKILRIDPGAPAPYIPPTNPFATHATRAREIWHWGLRNPWRLSFDRLTGDLWIGDVGEHTWEEIDFLPAGHAGGQNFGWDRCEGNHDFSGCASLVGAVPPVFEYSHSSGIGIVVVGGYVYRGTAAPSLYGKYVFGDGATGRVLAWDRVAAPVDIGVAPALSSFGEDQRGELYALALFEGRVYRISQSGGAGGFPALLSQTGLFSSTSSLIPAAGVIPYDVTVPFWSDNATKRRWIAPPAGSRVGFDPDRAWTVPPGTALVKHFDIPIGPAQTRRLETRVLLHQPASAGSPSHWVGVTYRWRTDQTDAALLTSGLDETISVYTGSGLQSQPYHHPAPFECLQCHNPVAGNVLGLRTAQMNRDFAYPGGSGNQLSSWYCAGLLSPNPGSPAIHERLPDPSDTGVPRTLRARSWLDVNCAMCHAPGAPAPGGMDLRRHPLLGNMNTIGVLPTQGNLGIANARRIAVGSSAQSVLHARVQSSQVGVHMPPQGRASDPAAVALLAQWINSDLGVLDSDADARADSADNCPYVSNDQRDGGGVGLTSQPDGIGDACQCGDLFNDGRITSVDTSALRNALANGGGTLNLALCNVYDPPGQAGRCDVADVVAQARALARIAPGISQRCRAAGVIPGG